MRTVRFDEPIIWHQLGKLDADTDYVMEDFPMGQLGELSDGKLQVVKNAIPESLAAFGDTKNICIIFGGGYGDILMITPVLRNIKKHWPEIDISVCCHEHTHFLLKDNPNVAHLMKYPVKELDLQYFRDKLGGVVLSHPGISFNPDIKTKHASELLNAGLPPLDSLKFDYWINQDLVTKMKEAFPKKKKHRIALQYGSTAVIRNWPTIHADNMTKFLLEAGIEVMYVGYPKSVNIRYSDVLEWRKEQIWNLSDLGFDMEESAAAVYGTCDLVVAPDSFFSHLANTLDIPLVCLMGSFAPETRRSPGHPLTTYFDGRSGCNIAPCFHHGRRQELFPKGAVCNQTGQCEALNVIDGFAVAAKVVEMLNKL